MIEADSHSQQTVDVIANLVLHYAALDRGTPDAFGESLRRDLVHVFSIAEPQRDALLNVADTHHVLVRLLRALEITALQNRQETPAWCGGRLAAEGARIDASLGLLQPICEALEARAGKVVVIKSLDHWPDIGSDLDLYTTAPADRVVQVMRKEFGATPVERSWGDRLGNKWNFKVPGLAELIEIHVRYLGQTGEQVELARRVVERRVTKTASGRTFLVAAPEERTIISTLQRMYRHFYFRLCDMVDITTLLQNRSVDFVELRRAADVGGIWPGVEAFLLLVHKYVGSFNINLQLPKEVLESKAFSQVNVKLGNGFLRVPKLPAAGLYGKQLVNAGVHRDLRAMFRLPLLPPLAISALFAYRLTGSDKGVW